MRNRHGSAAATAYAAIVAAVAAASMPSAVRGGWIDPDTPEEFRTTKSLLDGSEYRLVMSDEFETPGRTFADGHDPTWTALDKSDDDYSASGGGSLHFYNSSSVTTKNGYLQISTTLEETKWNQYDDIKEEWKPQMKHFKSGMVQSWEKFCFTGGIVEVDIVLPGDPYIGGLWPAIWLLGNIGRATYEASTNNIWPWSYDECDRSLQRKQSISACDEANHYGMNPRQGRGATEIDILEGMMGDPEGQYLPSTDPPVALPYADMTLQVAPGVPENRPMSGFQPMRNDSLTPDGHTELMAQTWYEGLEVEGNTTLNPFFYGTYLGETKPEEPVTRTKEEAFQADAVGAMHQLTPAHFKKNHKFRLEWRPGRGGRLDWYAQSHANSQGKDGYLMGDGKGEDWVKAYTLKDESLANLMGSKIPQEPSYLIFNIAISSTWGFPNSIPDWCEKCYDCSNSTCACAFHPGFCNMMKGGVKMLIDSVRVYQKDNAAGDGTGGQNQTVGCDPLEFPTREYIKGHGYRYMRHPPFSYEDDGPLKYEIDVGGGECESDVDCGGTSTRPVAPKASTGGGAKEERRTSLSEERGKCVPSDFVTGLFRRGSVLPTYACECYHGYTGPNCLAHAHFDESVSAYALRRSTDLGASFTLPRVTPFMVASAIALAVMLIGALVMHIIRDRNERMGAMMSATDRKSVV